MITQFLHALIASIIVHKASVKIHLKLRHMASNVPPKCIKTLPKIPIFQFYGF